VRLTMCCVGRTQLVVRPQNTTFNPYDLFAHDVLRCVGTSDPSTPPVITWYRLINGTVTQVNTSSSDGLAIDEEGSLIFRGVATTEWRQFIGWYRCVADNGYTSDSADLFLDASAVATARESDASVCCSLTLQSAVVSDSYI